MLKWILVAFSVLGAAGAALLVARSNRAEPVPPPRQEPVRKPYAKALAASGVVEPETESVVIGVAEPGRVTKVFVSKGQKVKVGDPLFQTDVSSLRAQRALAEAAQRSAEAELGRVRAYRRPEDEPALKARVEEAQAVAVQTQGRIMQLQASAEEATWSVKDHEDRVQRLKATVSAQASTAEELQREQFALEMARARLAASRAETLSAEGQLKAAQASVKIAEAELATYKAGPWAPDVEKAGRQVEEAKAHVTALDVEIERRLIRAPISGTVLRCSLHEGEYATATAGDAEQASVVVGDISRLRIRVDVDEFDAPRFRPGVEATGFLKGRPEPAIKLEYVVLEPFIVPKRALTNSQRELVDTRVLQAIYRVKSPPPSLYVGQQLDVFVPVESSGEKP